jgi:hypothetical protein
MSTSQWVKELLKKMKKNASRNENGWGKGRGSTVEEDRLTSAQCSYRCNTKGTIPLNNEQTPKQ